jgi:putative SOS response-associated peptidase YedK
MLESLSKARPGPFQPTRRDGMVEHMCGRYASARKKHELLEEFQVAVDGAPEEELRPDYNVAPTKKVYAVLTRPLKDPEAAKDAEAAGEPVRQLRILRWGLVPSWAKDPSVGSRMINARVETVAEKPSFRRAFARRRCLLPADGYYEWYAGEDGPAGAKAKRKQPYYIHPADDSVLALAGLYEFWRDRTLPADDPAAWWATCTIITTSAQDELGRIHDRMPMVVARDRWADWLDPGRTDPEEARGLLMPAGAAGLAHHPVSPEVGNVRNNGPELIEPLADRLL